MKPFNREKFLLYMLAGIFTWQAAVFTFGAISCFQIGEREACPNLGDRYENTVGIMVATTLALLGAGAVTSQKKPSVSDPASPLPLSPQAQGKVQELAQGSVQESVRGKGKGKNFDKAS
jgi:hypothetical protein